MAVTIPRAAVDFLTEEINGISADAQARVLKVLQGINWTPDNVAQCRDLVIQALAAVMPTYTDMAAQASADFYDAARELVVGEKMGAKAISGFDMRKTEGAVRGFVRFVVNSQNGATCLRTSFAAIKRCAGCVASVRRRARTCWRFRASASARRMSLARRSLKPFRSSRTSTAAKRRAFQFNNSPGSRKVSKLALSWSLILRKHGWRFLTCLVDGP